MVQRDIKNEIACVGENENPCVVEDENILKKLKVMFLIIFQVRFHGDR